MYNLRGNYCNSTPAVVCGEAEDKRVISHLFTPSAKLLLLHKSIEKLLLPWRDRIKSSAHVQQPHPDKSSNPQVRMGMKASAFVSVVTRGRFRTPGALPTAFPRG